MCIVSFLCDTEPGVRATTHPRYIRCCIIMESVITDLQCTVIVFWWLVCYRSRCRSVSCTSTTTRSGRIMGCLSSPSLSSSSYRSRPATTHQPLDPSSYTAGRHSCPAPYHHGGGGSILAVLMPLTTMGGIYIGPC